MSNDLVICTFLPVYLPLEQPLKIVHCSHMLNLWNPRSVSPNFCFQ